MKRTIVQIIFFIYCIANVYPQYSTIWQLGKTDNSSKEFALAPDGKDRFIISGFGDNKKYFYAGEHTPADFPYIIPGPTAEWAGSSYWAGQCRIQLPILIKLSDVNPLKKYQWNIFIENVEYEDCMFLRLEVNGKNYDSPIKPGTKQLTYSIQPGILKEGYNKIVMQLFNGKSLTFDAICLNGPQETQINKIGDTPIISMKMADYELEQGKTRTQPLLLKTITKKSGTLKIQINQKKIFKQVEEGENIYEIPTGKLKDQSKIKVKISTEGQTVATQEFIRSNQQLRRSIDYVDQFAGSSGSRWMIGPGPWMPFGMVKLMPDNEDAHWKAGYEYNVENIMGFSHIHEWTMTGLLMMPTTGDLKIQPGTEKQPDYGYRSRINKKTETARIGYYSVNLTDYNIQAELTATTRSSLQRYTFNKAEQPRILVDFFFPAEYDWNLDDVYVKKVSDTEIEGWTLNDCRSTGYHGVQRYKLHFVMQFDKPFKTMNGWIRNKVYSQIEQLHKSNMKSRQVFTVENNSQDKLDAGIFLDFNLNTGDDVMVRTGISLVSIDNARLNLEEEIARPFGWNFDKVVTNQQDTWETLFQRVSITTDNYLLKQKFYTNLYRSISPRTIWNDVNGEWIDMNGNKALIDKPGKSVYGGDSAWGMHWTLGPFYNLLYPEYMSNWIYTYEQFYRRGGWLPNGNPGMKYFRVMIGNPALPLIVSGYQHGIRDFDSQLMYRALIHQQTATMINYPGGGQVGNESYPDYITKGYVPLYDDAWDWNSPHYQSYVSNTMEYSYQDYCAAQYFDALNKKDDFNTFMKRSDNWKNIFDPSTGYVRPRRPNGEWIENTNPYHAPGFCEGSAWQFTWYVPHDVKSLINLIGERQFIDRLNAGFATSEKVSFNALGDNMGAYPINHGNETNMQAAYLFSYTSEPWHTQKWARAIQEKYYGMGPRDAYPGDEDQGQMSSWYILSSIGLFQMDGGCSKDPVWLLGSPRFDRVEILLDNTYYSGKKLIIKAENVSKDNCYIQYVRFNNKRLSNNYIEWSKFKKGGTLHFIMGDRPNPNAFK